MRQVTTAEASHSAETARTGRRTKLQTSRITFSTRSMTPRRPLFTANSYPSKSFSRSGVFNTRLISQDHLTAYRSYLPEHKLLVISSSSYLDRHRFAMYLPYPFVSAIKSMRAECQVLHNIRDNSFSRGRALSGSTLLAPNR